MEYFYISLIFFAVFLFLMAVGVIFGQIRIKGSCGGLSKITGKSCDFCQTAGSCSKDLSEEEVQKVLEKMSVNSTN